MVPSLYSVRGTRNGVTNPELARGIKCGGTKYVCRVAQQRSLRTRTGYGAVVIQAIIADDDDDVLRWVKVVRNATR